MIHQRKESPLSNTYILSEILKLFSSKPQALKLIFHLFFSLLRILKVHVHIYMHVHVHLYTYISENQMLF